MYTLYTHCTVRTAHNHACTPLEAALQAALSAARGAARRGEAEQRMLGAEVGALEAATRALLTRGATAAHLVAVHAAPRCCPTAALQPCSRAAHCSPAAQLQPCSPTAAPLQPSNPAASLQPGNRATRQACAASLRCKPVHAGLPPLSRRACHHVSRRACHHVSRLAHRPTGQVHEHSLDLSREEAALRGSVVGALQEALALAPKAAPGSGGLAAHAHSMDMQRQQLAHAMGALAGESGGVEQRRDALLVSQQHVSGALREALAAHSCRAACRDGEPPRRGTAAGRP